MPKLEERSVVLSDFTLSGHEGNPVLGEITAPIEAVYGDLKAEATKLKYLAWIDRCPEKFLRHWAASIGFELLDRPYASVTEQRNLLKWAPWVYSRKGTLTGIEKIVSILGFSNTYYEEEVSDSFMIGQTRLPSVSQIVDLEYKDDFNDGNVSHWEKQSSGSIWLPINEEYVGEGDGTDSSENASLQDTLWNYANNGWRISTKFRVVGGSGAHHPNFGLVIQWLDEWNYCKVLFRSSGGKDYLQPLVYYSGLCLPTTAVELEDDDYKTGEHTLVMWDRGHALTACVDDHTIFTGVGYPYLFANNSRKGLCANEGTKVAFDDFTVQKLNMLRPGVLYSTADVVKNLYIKLSGNPSYKDAKVEYLQQVLRNYVPFGVNVIVTT